MNNSKPLWKQDFFASLSLLLVSLPLSAGIAVASKADPLSGIITAIFGAIFFGYFSSSPLIVYGPAAGLAVFMSMGILKLGDYSDMSKSIFIAGIWLAILSFFNIYRLVNLFPRSVTKGMVTGIGLILILKMIPHLLGYDGVSIGTDNFDQSDGRNTITELYYGFEHFLPGAVLISTICLGSILIVWKWGHKTDWGSRISIAFMAVILGVLVNQLLILVAPNLALGGQHMLEIASVKIDFGSMGNLHGDWKFIFQLSFIITAVIILEGLLTLDIFQKVDPTHTKIDFKRELRLLGIGNVLMGMIGALPVMPVLIRSTANVKFGARSRWTTIMHGFWLAFALFFHEIFSYIPMASVAAVLAYIGINLINPRTFREMMRKGPDHYLPFLGTAGMMLFTNLLWGLIVGFGIGLVYSLRSITKRSMVLVNDDERYLLKFHKDVTFLHKAELREYLESVPVDKELMIDGTGNIFIDREIEDYLEEQVQECAERGQKVTFLKSSLAISKLFKVMPA